MRVEWYGQSAFKLSGEEGTVLIDPFGDMTRVRESGRRWDYPDVEPGAVDLVLVTHEHPDHNGVEVASGEPAVVRSRAGAHQTPLGEVVGVASEHDAAAGTERGDNTIFVFTLDGVSVAHFGDFGQAELRPEQRAALGGVELLLLPVGGGPTIGGTQAAEIAHSLDANWVVPHHYRTSKIDFLDPDDEFTAAFTAVARLETASFDTADLDRDASAPIAVIPAAP